MKNNYLDKIGLNALNASRNLCLLSEKKKNKALKDFYKNFKQSKNKILKANKIDIFRANKNRISKNLIDRLLLNDNKINSILKSIEAVIKLKDPTKNSQFGTMWITNKVVNKKIKKTEQIPEGWYRGRLKNMR